MTNQEILDFVASIHYVPLYVSVSLHSRRCGPGQDQWKRDVDELNETERFLLSARITRHLGLIAKKGEKR